MGANAGKPMDVVENTLAQNSTWIQADKKAGEYQKEFLTYQIKKKQFMGVPDSEATEEPTPEEKT